MKVTKAKAWVALAGVVVTALTAALADDVLNVGDVSALLAAIVPALSTFYAVYKTENKPLTRAR